MKTLRFSLAAIILALMFQACNLTKPSSVQPSAANKPSIVILSPDDNYQIQEGTTLYIASVSTDPKGLKRVDLMVDGKLENGDKVPDSKQSITLSQKWEPKITGPGKHTISVIATNMEDVASDPATITIQFIRNFNITYMSIPSNMNSIFAAVLPGAYTKAQPCGAELKGCTTDDHSLVPVDVQNGNAQGVDISDWYAPRESIPFIFMSTSGPMPAPDASSSPRTISGSVLYPATATPPMLIAAFSVNGFPNRYYESVKKSGDSTYKIQVPDGQYYIAAYAFPKSVFDSMVQAAPENLTAQKSCTTLSAGGTPLVGHISLQLTWTDTSTEDYYTVYYGSSSKQLLANTTSFTIDQNLPTGTSLDVKVVAHSSAGDGSSDTQIFTCP